MKTAAEMLDRLEALARRIAECSHSNVFLGLPNPEKSPGFVPADIMAEARAIVSELPGPVDEFEAAAKRYYDEWQNDGSTGPFAQDAMAYALRRAREEGVK